MTAIGAVAAGRARRTAQADGGALAAEIADGVLFANASLSHLAASLAVVAGGQARRPEFPDRQHAAGVHHRGRERGIGAAPPPAGALRAVAELPQLLEGSRLRRGDGERSNGRWPRIAGTTSRAI